MIVAAMDPSLTGLDFRLSLPKPNQKEKLSELARAWRQVRCSEPGGRLMIKTLADLVRPMSEADFAERFARKQLTFVEGPREAIMALLSLDEISKLLDNEILTPPRVRLRRDDKAFPKAFYTNSETGFLDPAAVHELLRKGASLILDTVGPLFPRLRHLEAAIERRLLAHTGINMYLTAKSGGAFEAHFDPQDVIIVQVLGKKHWQIFGDPVPPSASTFSSKPGATRPSTITWERVMEPGNVLFIPRGQWHQAKVDGDISLHLTITIEGTLGAHYIRWIGEKLATDDVFAQDIPRLEGPDGLAAYEARLWSRIAEVLRDLDLERFLAKIDAERARMSRFDLAGLRLFGDLDVIVSTLRRPLMPASETGAMPIEVRSAGQSHFLTPLEYQVMSEIDRHAGGLTHQALIDRCAGRWGFDQIMPAISTLREIGFIAGGPDDTASAEHSVKRGEPGA
jgi:ribosomal protein L16 Arg81 hydroxylase